MNSLLQRQIRRLLQDQDIEDPKIKALLDLVGKTYDEMEENKDFLGHTLEIVSSELTEANELIRRESENRLSHINHYFEETLAQQPNLIFRCKKKDDRYTVGLARGRLLEQLNIKQDELEEKGITPLFNASSDLEYFHRAWEGVSQHFEIIFKNLKLICHVWLYPLMEDNRVIDIIGIVSDITREKAAEDRLRQTSEALEQRAQELEKSRKVMLSMIEDLDQSRANISRERDRSNALAVEAAAANRAKSDFLATMSHEIRTPMNGVLGFTQLLHHSELTAQQMDFVTAIRTSAESLLRVINDVLDFSKIESGHMEIEASPFCLQTCIEEAVETVSTSAAEKNLDLAARVSESVPASIIADSLRLRQLLVNLLGNAIKFTSSGAVKLEVDASPEESGRVLLKFSVTDSGIGIAPDRINHLFKAFQQVDSSTSRRFGGSGLGLAICKRLVELMGGTISVESQTGVGSVFSFQISVPIAIHPAPLVSPIPFPTLIDKRVLLIDNHEFSRQVISELLQSWGMNVRSAPTTQIAAEQLDDWQPQLLLLDSACTSPEDVTFATSLASHGTTLFLLCQPGDAIAPLERIGNVNAGMLFKPLKVSPLFNALISDRDGSNTLKSETIYLPTSLHANGGSSLKILLAEDNGINRKLALAALAQMNCSADIALDGHEALNAAMINRYDLILMDVQMPGMDGLEATRLIRSWEKNSGVTPVRIIALTANALAGDRDICMEAGMDDYLSKPIRLEALRAALQYASELTPQTPSGNQSNSLAATKALRQLALELSPEDAISLASDFLGDLDGQMAAIREALHLHNLDETKRHSHSLKGTASIFCLQGLLKAAEDIEHACFDGHLEAAETAWPDLVNASEVALHDLRAAIHAVEISTVLKPMS